MSEKLKFGLLGENISYSKSPLIFKTIFEIDGVIGDYDLIDMKENKAKSSLKMMMESDYNAFSVTVPYKQTVINFLNKIDPTAEKIGAVNSVVIDNGKLIGYNTDFIGFARPLTKYLDSVNKREALVFGNGGSAKAVIFSLVNLFQVKNIMIVGRELDKLLLFKNDIDITIPDVNITLTSYEKFNTLSGNYSLIVNTTPLGGPNYSDKTPFPDNYLFPKDSIYYDLNYNSNNYSLSQAKKAGLSVINGVPMLIAQAVESYKIWTGRKISFEEVFDKLKASF